MLWSEASEVKQAVELLRNWGGASVEDAIELLGPRFTNKSVRGFAVEQLKRADDSVSFLQLRK